MFSIEDLATYSTLTPMAILGNAQHGKTNLAKHIIKILSKKPNVLIRTFDTSTKHLFNSACNVALSFKLPANVNGKRLIKKYAIPEETLKLSLRYKNILYDFSECDSDVFERSIQSRLIFIDKTRLIKAVKINRGAIKTRIVYVYEECQTILGTNILNKKKLSFLSKAISTGANYGLSLIMVTRRAAEVSTKVFEHTTVKAVANSSQPNDLKKLKSIFSKDAIKRIKTLGIGEFMVLTPKGTYPLKTPLFKGATPHQLTIKYVYQNKIRSKIANFLNPPKTPIIT